MQRWQKTLAVGAGRVGFVLCSIAWVALCLLILPFHFLYMLGRAYVYLPICVSVYLRGGVKAAWGRCIPLWIQQGSINDLRDKAVPSYSPSFPTILAWEFASKFKRKYKFVVSRLGHSEAEAECAIEMLVYQCGQMGEMPLSLTKQRLLIPKRELPEGRKSMTVGEYMSLKARDEYMSLKARERTTDVRGQNIELPMNSAESARL